MYFKCQTTCVTSQIKLFNCVKLFFFWQHLFMETLWRAWRMSAVNHALMSCLSYIWIGLYSLWCSLYYICFSIIMLCKQECRKINRIWLVMQPEAQNFFYRNWSIAYLTELKAFCYWLSGSALLIVPILIASSWAQQTEQNLTNHSNYPSSFWNNKIAITWREASVM